MDYLSQLPKSSDLSDDPGRICMMQILPDELIIKVIMNLQCIDILKFSTNDLNRWLKIRNIVD